MATLTYVATTMTAGPTTPTSCFPGNVFSPDTPGCSDMSWKSYLKNSGTTMPLPFMLIVPPSYSYYSASTQSIVNGGTLATKQFYLPLGADSTLDTFQLSRVQARATTLNTLNSNLSICAPIPHGAPWDSAMCLGMVFYSITFYRM